MGRRSRKRAGSPVAPPPRPAQSAPVPPPPAPKAATYKSRREDAPQPAWAPFPLTELCILLAIVLLVLGFLTHGDRRGVLVAGGVVLVTLSAGELALREHFAGYRSHSSLLAGLCALIAAIPVWLLPVPQTLVLVVGLLAFAGAFVGFRRAFVRRSGGVGFRA
ncbi:hypothetical protein FSW04_23035 [Baekduia soli]|uniref:Uncharacterized protein n=1 Tax=Baekduia soli TaxID=496014 RepID=A0A5B8UAY9_9ACTN|nr:hypothetical protein [Baekduia soli]QEC50167.1 hypothetical protein FSW04_23035 [Baekduia soli]